MILRLLAAVLLALRYSVRPASADWTEGFEGGASDDDVWYWRLAYTVKRGTRRASANSSAASKRIRTPAGSARA